MVNCRFYDGCESTGKLFLIDIMLILADTDRFRVDFYQLSQGILNPASDGDSAADGDIQVR